MKTFDEKLKEIFSDTSVKIVSFDLFDTLIFRKVMDPNYAFRGLKKNKLLKSLYSDADQFFSIRKSYEIKARRYLSKNKEDVTLEDIYSFSKLDKKTINKLINIELKNENNLLIPNNHLSYWIEFAHSLDKKIIIISDIYYSYEQLSDIAFSKIKNFKLISNVYISSEIKKLKKTGNLFKHVLEKENVNPSEVVHIGDNITSDFNVPKNLGLRTIHYGSTKFSNNIHQREKYFIKNRINDIQLLRTISIVRRKNFSNNIEGTYFDLGSYVFGPVLNDFCKWIFGISKKNNISQINCITREGYFFNNILNFYKQLHNQFNYVSINNIAASRASLFIPSFESDDLIPKNLVYDDLTVSDVYSLFRIKCLNNKINEFSNYSFIKSYYKKIDDNLLCNIIEKDLRNNCDQIISNCNIQLNLFVKYLNQIGFNPNSILFDFGGSGSILHAINSILKDRKPKINCLFYANQNSYLHSFTINSFLPLTDDVLTDVNYKISKLAPVIESLFNTDQKTTIGYKLLGDKVHPLSTGSNFNIHNLYKAFEDGVKNYLLTSAKYSNDINYNSTVNQKVIKKIINRFLTFPTMPESIALSLLPFEKDYKSDKKENLLTQESKAKFNELGIPKYLFNIAYNTKFKWASTIWPELELCRHNDAVLPLLKGVISRSSNDAKKLLNNLIESEFKEVTVYGTGELAQEIYPLILEHNIKIKNIIDSRANDIELFFENKKVLSPLDSILSGDRNFLIASIAFKNEMKFNLKKIASEYDLNINFVLYN